MYSIFVKKSMANDYKICWWTWFYLDVLNIPASSFMKNVGFSTKMSQCSFWFAGKVNGEKSSTSFNLEKCKPVHLN